MTEDQWHQTAEWRQLLPEHVRIRAHGADGRKLRLWTVACCREILNHYSRIPDAKEIDSRFVELSDLWSSQLDSAERFADGEISKKQLHIGHTGSGGPWNIFHLPMFHARMNVEMTTRYIYAFSNEYGVPVERDIASYIRDIFGNPFRPIVFDAAWRTSTAVGIAAKMYDSRDFAAMPILADALQDAGCESEAILNHSREEATHVRGCWVVDLVLGK